MPAAHQRPPSQKQYLDLLACIDSVCTGDVLDGQRIESILAVVFSSAEDYRHGAVGPGCPTPVERLLWLVSKAYHRLRRASNDVEGRYTVDQVPALHNIENLLEAAHGRRATVLSSVEQTQLYARWSRAALLRQLVADEEGRQRADIWELARTRREQLEERLGQVGPHSLHELILLQSWLTYQKAQAALFADRDLDRGLQLLVKLLRTRTEDMPPGLFFSAAFALHAACTDDFILGRRLRAIRWPIALSFAMLNPHPRHCLDRIGLGFLLALDAAFAGAQTTALRLYNVTTSLARALSDSQLTQHVRYRLGQFGMRVERALPTPDSLPEPGKERIADYFRHLSQETRDAVARDWSVAFQRLGYEPPSAAPPRLYIWSLQSFVGSATTDEQRLPVALAGFLRERSQVVGSSARDERRTVGLIVIGQVIRMLVARRSGFIDPAIREFETLIAFSVLCSDWQALLDALGSTGHQEFLNRKVGHRKSAEYLLRLAEHWQSVIQDVAVRRPAEGADQAIFEELTGDRTTHDLSADVKELEQISRRWRLDSVIDPTGVTVRKWLEGFGKNKKPLCLGGADDDPRLTSFFVDVATAERLAGVLLALSEDQGRPSMRLGELAIALSWCAVAFSRVYRRIDYGASSDWVERGVEWAEHALESARKLYRSNQYTAPLHRALEARVQLLDSRASGGYREDLRAEMLALAEARLGSTSGSRLAQSVLNAERSLSEWMSRDWCNSFRHSRPLDEIHPQFIALQQLKRFNYGSIAPAVDAGDDIEEVSDPSEQGPIELSLSDDDLWLRHGLQETPIAGGEAPDLLAHLREQRAAILDFLVHPAAATVPWEVALDRGWGTVCLVIRAHGKRLRARPFYLELADPLLRQAVYGNPFGDHNFRGGREFRGFFADLPYWPADGLDRLQVFQELSARLFPRDLVSELAEASSVYICPHRHLFQLPIHALQAGSAPLYQQWRVSYALKTQHIIRLLTTKSRQTDHVWALVDTSSDDNALEGVAEKLAPWIQGRNAWGEQGTAVDALLRRASQARMAIIVCHGQRDDRPGRGRLRLWGGGRILADDLLRIQADHSGTDYVVAACDVGASRSALQTTPGFALSLVGCGARSVTSSLYKVGPRTATRFIGRLLPRLSCRNPDAYTFACRETGLTTPRWTPENRPVVDTSKPATLG
jgi:hypothetical protein